MAQVPWQTLVAGGLVMTLIAMVGLVVRSILTGRLVPRSAVDDIRADRDKWESAWRLQQETLAAIDDRLDANTEALRLVEQLVQALATKGGTSV
ncbi:hypothetical protein [Actinomadura sp. LOL_011]|uniref:hypothetical protein n=1 Tax=Actinomadura sp. LOL_011 TaxID=3345410 RepID=UPI003A8065E6